MSLWHRPFPRSLFDAHQKRAHLLSLICLCSLVVCGVLLDQITKIQSESHLLVWSSPDDIRGYRGDLYPVFSFGDPQAARTTGPYFALNLSYVRNPGAAWGSLANLDDRIRVPLFHVITLLCVFFITFYLYSTPFSHRLARWALALILSGAVGNLIDRLRLHYVIDWIDFRWNVGGWYYAFPNFNVADTLISVGAFFFILDSFVIDMIRKKKLHQNPIKADQASGTQV